MADRKDVQYTSVSDVENPHVKKYNVSGPQKPGIRIPKLLCAFLVMGAILLTVLPALAVYLLMPQECTADTPPAALIDTAVAGKVMRRLIAGQSVPREFAKNREKRLTRLPLDVKPTHYLLKLMPFLIEDNFTTHGVITIDYDCIAETNKIVLHAVDVTINRDSIRVKTVTGDYFYRLKDLTYNDVDQMYTFHLDRTMAPGDKYQLHMEFVSVLNDLNQGFYRSSYTDKETNTVRWLASTQFSPIDARRAFPCFDEPAFKATFTISLARPNQMTSIANMPRINTEDSIEMPGYSWDHYETTPMMSTYLLAFVVSDLQLYEHNTDGREFRIWSRKDVISEAIYASQVTPKMLKYYEKYFDIPFPLPKLDQVTIPDFGYSAMENWGLITYREGTLLIDNRDPNVATITWNVRTIAHELSHQWFGNLVTPSFWDDLFLKEGFSEFFSYRGVNHVEPTWNITDQLMLDQLWPAMKSDIYSSSRSLSVKLRNNNDIRGAFDPISYSKGACIFNMLHSIYGEENFKDALKHYLNKFQFGNANYSQFLQAFMERNSRIAGLTDNNLEIILDSWVEQSGFPVVNVIADYDNSSLRLTQRRFMYEELSPEDEKKLWWIPVSCVTKTQPNFDDTKPKFWIEGVKETKVHLDIRDGYMLNLKHTGYYIVNYDERNWNLIALNFKHFPLLIRSQLIGNAMDLARANLLDYDIPFKMLITIGKFDNHMVPLFTALGKVRYVYDMMITSEVFTQFFNFLTMAFDTAFSNTFPHESPSDSYETKRLRTLILGWACMNPESRCVGHSRTLYRSLMISKTPIQENLRDIVYCTAIREGGEQEFNFAYQRYINTTVPAEKITLLKALGCTEEPWLLKSLLKMLLDKKSAVRKQDGLTLFTAIATNIRGYNLAFNFLRQNWNEFKRYYGLGFGILGRMVQPLSKYMNTPYDLEQLAEFGNEAELETAKSAFTEVYNDVQLNVRWIKNSHESVKAWLNMHSQHYGY